MKKQIVPADSAVDAVKSAVANLEGCRPDQLGSLDRVVDTDDLDALADALPRERTGPARSLVFSYCGYSVAVYSDRLLHVEA